MLHAREKSHIEPIHYTTDIMIPLVIVTDDCFDDDISALSPTNERDASTHDSNNKRPTDSFQAFCARLKAIQDRAQERMIVAEESGRVPRAQILERKEMMNKAFREAILQRAQALRTSNSGGQHEHNATKY